MFFRKKNTGPIEFIIVGLGNPGKQYEGTRHNAGFMALEALAEKQKCSVSRVKFKSLCGETEIQGKRVLLMKPQTYMNLSGQAVTEAMRFYKLPPEQVLVMYDDISLPPGTIRIRRKGSDGGQKGMANIIYLSGSDQFPRIRLGIGDKPHPDYELAAWVLSKFTPAQAKLMVEAAQRAAEAAALIVGGQMEQAMNLYSR